MLSFVGFNLNKTRIVAIKIHHTAWKPLESLLPSSQISQCLEYVKNINKHYKAPTKQWTYIRPLRTLLYKMFDEGVNKQHDTIVYELLIYLAEKKPINTKSYIDLMPIPQHERFLLASGHQYNINNLAHWIREKKSFVAPHDNLILFPKDIERFKKNCLDRGIEWVKPVRKVSLDDLVLTSAELVHYRIPVFSVHHKIALRTLMTGRQELSRQHALQELAGLQPYQAASLGSLYNYGLRGEHFRDLWSESIFNEMHAEQLGSYILIEQYSPANALIETNRNNIAARAYRANRPRFFEPAPVQNQNHRIANNHIAPVEVEEIAANGNNRANYCRFFTTAIAISSVAAAAVALNYI